MRVPPEGLGFKHLQAIGLVIAGMVIGAALFLSIYNARLNMMIEQNRELLTENSRLEGDVANLRKTKNQQTTINLLNVYIDPDEHTEIDKVTESELQRRVHAQLKPVVVGRKISEFAAMPDVYEQILKEKPLLGVLDKDYLVLSVRWIVLTQSELKVWVTVKEWKRIPVSMAGG
ncbi:hypothetical protein SAMN02799630_02630 [Paenibacillus sp. UNCCL117]|uniref:hypothetical protein n=1 Tax=unclassified Paenibacillus TaxID=185978 RepID=UPI000882251E|nr:MULTISPECIES: hypothetical protein [unclassified Paenibacillus]SDC08552.1 hypothetical protein SAMN04488602_101299 [Paenibacillus sp. cl123]SFW38279.1 hypothetical protein SAMN02799630_02630 [Paenibacillus sp. UNCCL117]